MVRLPLSVACPQDCPNRHQGCHNDTCATHVRQQEFLEKQRATDYAANALRRDMIASGNRHRAFSGWIERPQTLRKKANKQIW